MSGGPIASVCALLLHEPTLLVDLQLARGAILGWDCAATPVMARPTEVHGVVLAWKCDMPLLARDLMQVDPVTVLPGTPFLQIQHLFVVALIGGAPVVDDRGTVHGVISATDLLRVADQAFDDEVDSEAQAQGSFEPSNGVEPPEQLGSLTAIDIASPEPIWVSPDCAICEVARLMRAEGIHRVLVGHDGRLAGILTAFDLLQAVSS